jgi:aryl-alcohol dehydrogenase-like predicted oxidoreductase
MAQPLSARHLGAAGPEITTVGFGAWAIVGARSPQQVDGWLAAATTRLDPDDLAAIEAAIAKTGAGAGSTLPRKA